MKKSEPRLLTFSGVNLRRDPEVPQMLRRARTPERIGVRSLLPLCSFEPYGDGRTLTLLVADKTLIYTWDGTEIRTIGRVGAEPVMAVTDTPGVVRLLLRQHTDYYYTYGSDLKLTPCGYMPELPEIRLFATGHTPLQQAVAPVKLSGASSGNAGSQLTANDARTLTDALLHAYDALESQARTLGACFQPLLARCRVLDAAGNTLSTGPTVMVAPASGVNATDAVVQSSADSMASLTGSSLSATAFRIGFNAPAALPAPWNRLAARLVVEVSDQLAPADRSSLAVHGIVRDRVSGVSTVTSRVPGLGDHTGVSRARFRRLGCALAAAPMRTVVEYSYPFAGGIAPEGSTVTVDATAEGTPAPAAGEVAPGRRTYSAALQLDNITVLCNPRTETFRGWAPESFITRRSDSSTGNWRCAISVKIASPGGDTVVCREIHGTGHAPEAFAPMLSYPSADAVEIAIDLTGAAGHRSGLYQLAAVPGAQLAVWASPGLEPFLPPAATVYAPPTSTVTPATVEQGVAEIHSSADMRRTLSRRRIARSRICAVAPAPRGHSGWDFSRAKLLFFSEEGTTLSTIDAEGSFRATSRVDRRPVRSPLAVCHASDSAGAAIAAIAGDDLVVISGQRARTLCHLADIPGTVAAGATATLGYDPAQREYWVATGGRSIVRISADGRESFGAEIPVMNCAGDAEFSDTVNPFAFALWQGELIARGPRGTWRISADARPGTLPVRLSRRYDTPFTPSMLRVNLFASQVTGTVRLSGDSGSEEPVVMLAMTIDGELNAPVTQPLMVPRRRFLTADYAVEATADLSILPETFI